MTSEHLHKRTVLGYSNSSLDFKGFSSSMTTRLSVALPATRRPRQVPAPMPLVQGGWFVLLLPWFCSYHFKMEK